MAETYHSLTDIVKLCDNLVAARPSDDMWGILTVRNSLGAIPAADVVARDCYDKILAENDDMRAIIDTYGGIENIQSAFVKLHEIEAADVVPVVRCGECKHYVPAEDDGEMMCVKDADWCVEDGCYYGFTESHDADWFCADGERKDGDGDA